MIRLGLQAALVPVGLALALAGCADGNGGGGADAGSGAAGPDASTSAEACPDHPNVTDTGEVCAISGGDSAPVTQDLTLTADSDYLLDGPVFIGDDTDETVLSIERGVTIFGGDGSFLLIQRGSKIVAEGTADAPIVLTSAKAPGDRGSSDWGGLVINGRAPINNGNAAGEADGEAGSGTYGGDLPEDDSGVLEYVRVEFAGNKVDSENELNGIALQGVGSGTRIDFIQTHMTSDDGIEFFGGTVNVKHVVATAADDDSIDWTGGWQGAAQFVVAEQSPASGEGGERGIEADNLEGDTDAAPFSSPTLANFTLVGRDGNDSEGVLLRRGTKGSLHNFIISGFGGVCINVDGDQTVANADSGDLELANHVHDCAGGRAPQGDSSTAKAARDLVAGDATGLEADPMLDENWMPQDGSPALGIGDGPEGAFFEAVDYAGAFDGETNWAQGWLQTATD